jgi:hypothetical protein
MLVKMAYISNDFRHNKEALTISDDEEFCGASFGRSGGGLSSMRTGA